jgi:hypothetical protein
MLAIALLTLAAETSVEFNRDVRPILSGKCFNCHGPDGKARKANLRLDVREAALKKARSGLRPIVPGDPDKSELITRVTSEAATEVMPPAKSGKSLTPAEISILKRWVQQGANYAQHWAWVKPIRPPVPAVKEASLARNPIDRFLLARLEGEKLSFSAESDRAALLRRASIDLTGLPPTLADADLFLNDRRPDAYERAVDRILASPAFGERWAVTGSTWLATPTHRDTPTTPTAPSGRGATGSSTPLMRTCRMTSSPSSSWPATCCRTRRTSRNWRRASTATH